MAICEAELDAQLREMRKITRRPALPFVTVAGIEYLVEIPVKEAKSTPPKWIKVQS
jgi:DNA mismatch repair protein MSH3